MSQKLDLAGQRFERLTVVEQAAHYISPSGKSAVRWLCLCDCGATTIVTSNVLRRGTTKSCGCLHRDVRILSNVAMTRHGQARGKWKRESPEYKTWGSMKQRCNNPRSEHYANYGGRGIRVCSEWERSFEAFIEAVGPRPSSKHSIDRIDNDRGYEPSNVRWSTAEIQARNRRVRPDNRIGVTGVSLTPDGTFRAQIGVSGRLILLGTFKSVDEATMARQRAEKRHWRHSTGDNHAQTDCRT